MRGELPNLLVSVHLHGLWVVEGGDDLIRVYRDQDGSGVGLSRCLSFKKGFLFITYIDLIPIISDKKVPQNPGLIQITETDHVLHSPDGSRVHGLDPPLRRQPLLLSIIIDDLDSVSLGPGDDPRPQGHIKLPLGHWLYPDVITLHTTNNKK